MPKTEDIPAYVPRIGIKIRREGDWLKFKIGKYQLRTKDIGNQEYDLVTIEQFLTKMATLAYQNIIQNEKIKADLQSAIDWDKKNGKDTKEEV